MEEHSEIIQKLRVLVYLKRYVDFEKDGNGMGLPAARSFGDIKKKLKNAFENF